ncbi:MAG: transcriptional repressor NrdR, partial [Clostridia bacterium]|nr:transcriptional repressor NrdR [Clostridia bacterium]
LFKVILVACGKRPVPVDVINQMIDEIETDIQNTSRQEVESSVIGELVMKKLKVVDEVAYVRFASVYRQFTDIGTFQKELNKLIDGN